MTDSQTVFSEAVFLRDAAAILRRRLQAASGGPWFSWIEGRDHRGGDSFIDSPDADLYVAVGMHGEGAHEKFEANQDYIAMMDPVLGAALADWLKAEAAAFEVYEAANTDKALVVAKIIVDKEARGNSEYQE